MDQNALVTDEFDGGRKLVERLMGSGFDVSLAFWVKETDVSRWYLYLASSMVEDKGATAAYRVILPIIESMPELGIDLFAIKLVGINDSIALEVREVIEPKLMDGTFAVRNPKPYRGMTRFGGSTLGGMSIDGAYIYPPPHPAAST